MTPLDPARMMLGRDLKLPVDLCFGRPEEEPIETTGDYVATLQKKIGKNSAFCLRAPKPHVRVYGAEI